MSRKFNDTGLRYRASNMITIPYIMVVEAPYIMVVEAHFKSAVGGDKESKSLARNHFQAVLRACRGL